ncbi:Hypothetical predicted protein, partial [Olea europaea subsp. europaea]
TLETQASLCWPGITFPHVSQPPPPPPCDQNNASRAGTELAKPGGVRESGKCFDPPPPRRHRRMRIHELDGRPAGRRQTNKRKWARALLECSRRSLLIESTSARVCLSTRAREPIFTPERDFKFCVRGEFQSLAIASRRPICVRGHHSQPAPERNRMTILWGKTGRDGEPAAGSDLSSSPENVPKSLCVVNCQGPSLRQARAAFVWPTRAEPDEQENMRGWGPNNKKSPPRTCIRAARRLSKGLKRESSARPGARPSGDVSPPALHLLAQPFCSPGSHRSA